MKSRSIRASAPGSMMVLGEHSVLRGKSAIILAVQQRITITASARTDSILQIQSPLGIVTTPITDIQPKPPLTYALKTCQLFPPPCGLNITITSELSPTMGLGTSAAVVMTLLGVLNAWADSPLGAEQLFHKGLAVIHDIQGAGSGADLMASLKGGIGLYQAGRYDPLSCSIDLCGAYSGWKTPTPQVITHVAKRFAQDPDILSALDEASHTITMQATKALHQPERLGHLMNISAGLMASLGVHTPELEAFLWRLRSQSHGAKLSGSGLGDCAICVAGPTTPTEETFPIHIASQGLVLEEV